MILRTICSLLLLGGAVSTTTISAEETAPEAAEPTTADIAAKDAEAVAKFSHAVGMYMADQAKGLSLDKDMVMAGFTAGLADDAVIPPQAEMATLQQAFQEAQNRPIQAISEAVIANTDIETAGPEWKKAQGLPDSVHDEFYNAFIAMEGVKVTESGLAYKVLTAAEGAQPTASDTVTVHYVGRHTTGEIFDSSVSRGEPTSFPLNGVIPGWTEGLQLQQTGSTFRFVIPGKLAYGELQEGSPRPTGVLVFDVTLLKIN